MLGAINKVKAGARRCRSFREDEGARRQNAPRRSVQSRPRGPLAHPPPRAAAYPPNPEGTPEMRLLSCCSPPRSPRAPPPAGTYNLVQIIGNQVLVSGTAPSLQPQTRTSPRSGRRRTRPTASSAWTTARRLRGRAPTCLRAPPSSGASIRQAPRQGERVVNATPEFTQHRRWSTVQRDDGEMFGEQGRDPRLGCVLPRGWPEVDAVEPRTSSPSSR